VRRKTEFAARRGKLKQKMSQQSSCQKTKKISDVERSWQNKTIWKDSVTRLRGIGTAPIMIRTAENDSRTGLVTTQKDR